MGRGVNLLTILSVLLGMGGGAVVVGMSFAGVAGGPAGAVAGGGRSAGAGGGAAARPQLCSAAGRPVPPVRLRPAGHAGALPRVRLARRVLKTAAMPG